MCVVIVVGCRLTCMHGPHSRCCADAVSAAVVMAMVVVPVVVGGGMSPLRYMEHALTISSTSKIQLQTAVSFPLKEIKGGPQKDTELNLPLIDKLARSSLCL